MNLSLEVICFLCKVCRTKNHEIKNHIKTRDINVNYAEYNVSVENKDYFYFFRYLFHKNYLVT